MDGNPESFISPDLYDDILSIAMEIGFGSCYIEGVEKFSHSSVLLPQEGLLKING